MIKGELSENIILDKSIYIIFLTILLLLINYSKIIGSQRLETYQIGVKKNRVKWIYIGFAYFIYIFFSIFREISPGLGGTDAYGYYVNFMHAQGKDLISYIKMQNVEVGYSCIVWFVSNIFKKFYALLFLIHSICYLSLLRYCSFLYIKEYKVLILFVIFFNLFDVFNTLRNTLAVCAFLNILIEIERKRYMRAFLMALLIVSMHISAIIIIPVIAFNIIVDLRKKRLKKLLCFLLVIGLVASFMLIPLIVYITEMSGKYYVYGKSGVAYPVYAVTFFVFIVAVKECKKIMCLSKLNRVLITTLPICLFVMPFQQQYGVLYRMTLYFMPVLMGLYSSILHQYGKSKVAHWIIRMTLIMYLFVRVYKLVTINLYDVGLPYRFSFNVTWGIRR